MSCTMIVTRTPCGYAIDRDTTPTAALPVTESGWACGATRGGIPETVIVPRGFATICPVRTRTSPPVASQHKRSSKKFSGASGASGAQDAGRQNPVGWGELGAPLQRELWSEASKTP